MKRDYFIIGILLLFGIILWLLNIKLILPSFLTFSDSAKFADIARNLVSGMGFGASFAPFQKEFLEVSGLLPTAIPPLFPFLLAFSFKIFGITDSAVIITSGFFYLAGAMTLYFLGKKIFGGVVGFLASIAFLFDPAILNYATNGASESLFIFEVILAALLVWHSSRISLFFSFLVFLLMFFTRPSAIIYIAGFILFFILLRFKKKEQIFKAIGLFVVVWLLVELILSKFAGNFFLYSPFGSFWDGTTKFSPLLASTETLRGGMVTVSFQIKPFLSKFFYNLYNFYKLLPLILSPYLAAFYLLSLFRWEREREKRVFRVIVLLMVLATFIATAATLPIFRYLHPVIPFVYLLAAEMLVWILAKMFASKKTVIILGIGLVFLFVGGQTLGKIFLDSRFLRAHTSQGKPPVYVKLSWILKEKTKPDDLIITNLDTWGSWYGERKTIWFPLRPEQLMPKEGDELKVDAIYLTSYKIEDENYYMGESWREIFLHPKKLENQFIANNFVSGGEYEISPEETYEKEGAQAVLLLRKNEKIP